MVMRHGINHISVAEVMPLDTKRAQIFGIPIEYHENSAFPTADARGFFWNRRIVIGPLFSKLDQRTQRAVLLHEARHLLRFHREQRFLLLALLAAPSILMLSWMTLGAIVLTLVLYYGVEQLAQWHELDADAFAAKNGYGSELLALVRKAGPPPTLPTFYPDFETRCEHLEGNIKEKANG